MTTDYMKRLSDREMIEREEEAARLGREEAWECFALLATKARKKFPGSQEEQDAWLSAIFLEFSNISMR